MSIKTFSVTSHAVSFAPNQAKRVMQANQQTNQTRKNDITKLSDKDLYQKCQEYGMHARKWQRKFAALLPEVNHRRLHKKYGFCSLYEFAAKLAGISPSAVDEIIRVNRKLENKPVLKDLMKEEGWGKLRVIATVATQETQDFWAEKVKEMSKSTLQTYVRELRKMQKLPSHDQISTQGEAPDRRGTSNVENRAIQNTLFTNSRNIEEFRTGSCTPANTREKNAITFRLDAETETELRIFKQQLEKKMREPLDWNTVLKNLLMNAQAQKVPRKKGQAQKASRKKGQITETTDLHLQKKTSTQSKEKIKATLPKKDKRYIPARVKKYLDQKYKGKCALPDCKKPAEIYHHTRRFALIPNHNPDFIKPLCRDHERIAQSSLYKNEDQAASQWQLLQIPNRNTPKYRIDQIVNRFRLVSKPP